MDNEYLKSLGAWFDNAVGFVVSAYHTLNETQQVTVIDIVAVSVLIFVYAWAKTRKPHDYKEVEKRKRDDVWNYEPSTPKSKTTQEQPQRRGIEPSVIEKHITKEDILEWYRNPGAYDIRDRGYESSGGSPMFSGEYGLFKRDDKNMKIECDFCGVFVDESIYLNEGCPKCGRN